MNEQEARLKKYKATAEKRKLTEPVKAILPCANCGGTGKLQVVDEIFTFEDCTRCEGTGEIDL